LKHFTEHDDVSYAHCQSDFFCFALFAGNVFAQQKFIRSDFEFTASAPPVSLLWQLATPSGEHVDLAIDGIQPSPGGQEFAYIIGSENAAQYGVDFPAWANAVNDTDYSRSIMTFAGITKEQPVVRNFPNIALDDLRIFIGNYRWPVPAGTSAVVQIGAAAVDFPVVPEPCTPLLVVALGFISLSIRPTSRFRQYTNRPR
jgi:hypothetical protein